MIVTEMCVIDVTPEGLVLSEINPDFSVEDVQKVTEPKLIIPKEIKNMEI
jgi:acetate CoA/acetoacetate CoA-transferase beta subunit